MAPPTRPSFNGNGYIWKIYFHKRDRFCHLFVRFGIYGSCLWDHQVGFLQEEIEKFRIELLSLTLTSNYCFETVNMAGILEKLRWESLKKRSRDSRLILLHKGLKGAASITIDDLIPTLPFPKLGAVEVIVITFFFFFFFRPPLQELTFIGPSFSQTIRDWNAHTDSIIASAEVVEGGVTRFTSLVRARHSQISQVLLNECPWTYHQ